MLFFFFWKVGGVEYFLIMIQIVFGYGRSSKHQAITKNLQLIAFAQRLVLSSTLRVIRKTLARVANQSW